MSYYNFEMRRVAQDAAEAAVSKARADAARAESLRKRLEQIIGTVPEEHVTADQVGRYGLEKFRQDLPRNGNHAEALEYYLAGCASRAHDAMRRGGMDSRETPDWLQRFLGTT